MRIKSGICIFDNKELDIWHAVLDFVINVQHTNYYYYYFFLIQLKIPN